MGLLASVAPDNNWRYVVHITNKPISPVTATYDLMLRDCKYERNSIDEIKIIYFEVSFQIHIYRATKQIYIYFINLAQQCHIFIKL